MCFEVFASFWALVTGKTAQQPTESELRQRGYLPPEDNETDTSIGGSSMADEESRKPNTREQARNYSDEEKESNPTLQSKSPKREFKKKLSQPKEVPAVEIEASKQQDQGEEVTVSTNTSNNNVKALPRNKKMKEKRDKTSLE